DALACGVRQPSRGTFDRDLHRGLPHGSRPIQSSTLSGADCARAARIHLWMAGGNDHERCAARTSHYGSVSELSPSNWLVEDKRHLARQHRRGMGYPRRNLEASILRLRAPGERLKVARSETGERALIIMAKAPRAGHVKTRLAGRLLDEAIVNLYRCMIEDTL